MLRPAGGLTIRFVLLLSLSLASSTASQTPAAPDAAPVDTAEVPIDYLGIEHEGQRATLDYGLRFGRDWLRDNAEMAPFGLAVVAPGVPNPIAVNDPSLDNRQSLMMRV